MPFCVWHIKWVGKVLSPIVSGLGYAGFFKLNSEIQMSRNHGNQVYAVVSLVAACDLS